MKNDRKERRKVGKFGGRRGLNIPEQVRVANVTFLAIRFDLCKYDVIHGFTHSLVKATSYFDTAKVLFSYWRAYSRNFYD